MTDEPSPAPQPRDPERLPARPPAVPELRATDADRERVVELLRQAAGDGRLDVDELDERASAAYATRTLAGLQELTQDLVPARQAPVSRPSSGGGVTVRPGEGGTRRIISIMSGHEYTGRWRVAARCLVVNVMGGSEIDLNDAELADREVEIRVVSVMGGCEVRVPSGVDVQVSRFALMGGHDVKLDPDPPPAGGPVIRIKLFALMGGGEVRQGRRTRKKPPRR